MNYQGKFNFPKIVEKYKIKTNDDYIANMHHFAAVPKYNLKFGNNMPWFDHYEVKIEEDTKWKRTKSDSFKWSLIEGINLFQVRAVNQAGLPGPVTSVKVEYR